MPLYDVQHSYPLTNPQKQQLAEAITKLHSSAFLTPSIFVHVTFTSRDASEPNYYLAGKPLTDSTNRIVGMVRTSSSRTKAHFDKLAEQIENAWLDTVSGEVIEEGKDKGKREKALDDTKVKSEAKSLILVAFYGMVGARENSHIIPEAGGEAEWFQEMKPEFQKRADSGNEWYKDMLQEVEDREDLKKAYGA